LGGFFGVLSTIGSPPRG